jgi:hypothetical protein
MASLLRFAHTRREELAALLGGIIGCITVQIVSIPSQSSY